MHLNDDGFQLLARDQGNSVRRDAAEAHVLTCRQCCDRVSEVRASILAMERSERARRPEVIFWQLHLTADGPVEIWVEQTTSGRWRCRYVGRHLDGGMETHVRETALVEALQGFAAMFPEHQCSEACLVR